MTQLSERIRKVRQFKREIYQEYGFYYYVPMAEAYTVQVPVTVSCSYGKCLYCDLNQGMSFRELSLTEIETNIEKLRYVNDKPSKRFLLAGGNPFVLSAEKLLRISDIIHSHFPECEYISAFSRADDITRKSPDDLRMLHESGYDRLCIGIESGCDDVLKFHEKGVTRSQNLEAMKMLDDAGIKYSTYIMLGLGGHSMSVAHVKDTASLLNNANPFELTVVTLVLFKGARLIEKVRSHEFLRMSPFDALKEERELLSLLDINTIFDATHKTNLFPIKGRIPEHKNMLTKKIDDAVNEILEAGLKQYELKRWHKWGIE